MPRISKQYRSIKINDVTVSFDFDIMYSTRNGFFYIIIPNRFDFFFQSLGPKGRSEYHVQSIHKGKFASSGLIGNVVIGKSETEVVDHLLVFCREAGETSTKTRPVIMVWFEDHNDRNTADRHAFSGRRQKSETHFPTVGFEFKFFYAEERRIGDGNPHYYEINANRPSQHIPVTYNRNPSVVMDDTPERRAMLEKIYDASDSLANQLKLITSTEKTFTNFIEDRQPLKLGY